MSTIITPAPAQQRPSGKLYLGTNQLNLVTGTLTLVELDTVAGGFDDGIEDTTQHRITPGYAGFYSLMGIVTLESVIADHVYEAGIKISGSTWACFNRSWTGSSTLFSVLVLDLLKLSATDYVELWARSGAGVDTVDIRDGLQNTFLSVQRVR